MYFNFLESEIQQNNITNIKKVSYCQNVFKNYTKNYIISTNDCQGERFSI